MTEIHILDCGSTFVDEALPLSNRSRNPLAFTGIGRKKKHRVEVPVTAYLIRHPKADILVDTGWDTRIREDARAYEGFLNYFASPGVLPEGKAVTEHLKDLGLAPEDLDYVILTHMDIDHAGGIRLVRNAKRILASRAEREAASHWNPRYHQSLWEGIRIDTFPNEKVDLLGDGSIVLMPFPGHSAGMTGIRVNGKDGFVIIAGDCGYARQSWEDLVLPGVMWNKKKARASLEKLQKLGRDPACRAILMTHDNEYRSGVIRL